MHSPSYSHLIVSSLAVLALIGSILTACGPEYEPVEYTHDPNAIFSENWATEYTKVISCKQSPTHANTYVETWISMDGLESYKDRSKEMPKGAIVLKAQYKDEACTVPDRWTVMRKNVDGAFIKGDPKGWDWQRVWDDGRIQDSFDSSSTTNWCADCHGNSGIMPHCNEDDYLCDKVE